MCIKDLPFLEGEKLPRWCEDVRLRMGKAKQFERDIDFLVQRPVGEGLRLQITTGPGRIWYALLSLIYYLLISNIIGY